MRNNNTGDVFHAVVGHAVCSSLSFPVISKSIAEYRLNSSVSGKHVQALVNTITTFRVPEKVGSFVTKYATISFSKLTLINS
jgi:hypothetical protein